MTSDRRDYISSPLPIEHELLRLFGSGARMTMFDIGACEGEDTVRYARLFPEAAIYAVEPIPSNLDRLHATLAQHRVRNVLVLPFALSNTSGTAQMHVSSGNPPGHDTAVDWDYGNKSSSLLEPSRHMEVTPWIRFDTTITVEVRRLDDICQELAIPHPEYLHIDVQGAELMVLEGANRALADVRAMWLEVEAIPLYRGQPLKPDVETFLRSRGFEKAKDTVGPISGDQLWTTHADRALLDPERDSWRRAFASKRGVWAQRFVSAIPGTKRRPAEHLSDD